MQRCFILLVYSLLLMGVPLFISGCGSSKAETPNSEEPSSADSSKRIAASSQLPEAEPVVITDQVVEASCGECQFGMAGDLCDLAIRIDGESYFVVGSSIDDHGDAHGKYGLCNCVRQAKVSGTIKNGRFHVEAFHVLDLESAENKSAENKSASNKTGQSESNGTDSTGEKGAGEKK